MALLSLDDLYNLLWIDSKCEIFSSYKKHQAPSRYPRSWIDQTHENKAASKSIDQTTHPPTVIILLGAWIPPYTYFYTIYIGASQRCSTAFLITLLEVRAVFQIGDTFLFVQTFYRKGTLQNDSNKLIVGLAW